MGWRSTAAGNTAPPLLTSRRTTATTPPPASSSTTTSTTTKAIAPREKVGDLAAPHRVEVGGKAEHRAAVVVGERLQCVRAEAAAVTEREQSVRHTFAQRKARAFHGFDPASPLPPNRPLTRSERSLKSRPAGLLSMRVARSSATTCFSRYSSLFVCLFFCIRAALLWLFVVVVWFEGLKGANQ